MPWPGPISEIRRQAFGRRQPRPFADEQHDHGRIKQVADVIQNADATVADDERLAERPAPGNGTDGQQRQQTWDLGDNGRGRQAVADDNLEIDAGLATAGELGSSRGGKPATSVWAEQVFLLRLGLRLHFEKAEPGDEIGAKVGEIELSMDCIAGSSVVAAEVEVRGGAVTRPSSADEKAGRRSCADGGEKVRQIWLSLCEFAHGNSSADRLLRQHPRHAAQHPLAFRAVSQRQPAAAENALRL